MKLFQLLTVVLTVYGLVFLACSSNDSDSASDDTENTTVNINSDTDASKSGGLSISVENEDEKVNINIGGGDASEVIDFRELKKLMPEKLVGLERTAHEGQKAGMMGFNISTAQATYKEDDKRIEVSINDIAGFGAAISSMAAWSTIEIDRESEDGYERTTTIDGHKAFEKYDAKTQRGEYNVLVNDRFIVTMEARNIDEDDFKKAFEQIKWKKLTSK
ncbi:MAG: hypothetical protein AAF798_20065 [Bacteroidota bacterium]